MHMEHARLTRVCRVCNRTMPKFIETVTSRFRAPHRDTLIAPDKWHALFGGHRRAVATTMVSCRGSNLNQRSS
jgi:hypothetical protein